MNQAQPSEAQKELLTFINPTDAPDISIGLRKVFNMALFENNRCLTCEQKDCLFYLEKIIDLTQKI